MTLHGGSVEGRSAGDGMGSEFVVRLPLRPGTSQTTTPPSGVQADTPAGGSRPMRILVVDDNADAAELLALLLRAEGHEVMTAGDGPTAPQMARDFLPTVALLDLGLPGMDGYEVARQLRQNAALADAALARDRSTS